MKTKIILFCAILSALMLTAIFSNAQYRPVAKTDTIKARFFVSNCDSCAAGTFVKGFKVMQRFKFYGDKMPTYDSAGKPMLDKYADEFKVIMYLDSKKNKILKTVWANQ